MKGRRFKDRLPKDRRLREFEELVLLSVLIATPDAYGPSLQQILEEEAGRKASLGAIYTALERLARKGLVLSELGDPTPVRGGRRKRHYELTPEGLERVHETRRIRERMWEKAAQGLLGEEAAK
ncbi:MAG: PadR family transcriptional regulator [Gemmatimonadota bacterium]|jgi:DNA-binding PadR family transcriptional regulator